MVDVVVVEQVIDGAPNREGGGIRMMDDVKDVSGH